MFNTQSIAIPIVMVLVSALLMGYFKARVEQEAFCDGVCSVSSMEGFSKGSECFCGTPVALEARPE